MEEINVGRSVRQLGLPTVALDSHVDALLAALAAPGALAVTGQSGAGKSALVNRTFRRLRADGWAVAANIGRWYPRDVFHAVAGALSIAGDEFPNGPESIEKIMSGTDNERLDLLCDLLARTPLALAFDDFGQNLDGDRFIDPGFEAIFARLCAAADVGRIVATARTPVPGLREHRHEPTLEDAVRLAQQLPAMRELEQSQQATIIALLNGAPRLMGLANTWLNAGGDSLEDAYLHLMLAVAEAHTGPEEDRPDRLRASLIELHLRLVKPAWLEVLLQAAISTFPLTTRHLAVACGEELHTVDEAFARLQGLHLVIGINEGELLVERWIAAGLAHRQGVEFTERHERAMQMHNAEMREQRNTYADVVAITRSLVVVKGWADLTWFTVGVTGPAAGTLAAAAVLGEVVPAVPIDNAELPDLVARQVAVLRECHLDEAAQRAAERFRERAQEWVERDGSPEAYDCAGDAARLAGDAEAAEAAYRTALEPRQRQFEAATNAGTLRALCRSFERLADLVRDSGDLEAAERFYRTRLAAAEAMHRTNPDDEEIAQEYARARKKLEGLLATQ